MMSTENSCDLLLVGSGIGALTAGAIEARAGKRVIVCEQHYKAGGYAHTFKRKGYIFDVSLHQIGGVHKTAMHDILTKAGIADKIEWIKHPLLSKLQLPSGEFFEIPNGNPKLFMQKLIARYPEERKPIESYFRDLRRFGKQVRLYERRLSCPLKQAFIDAFAPVLVPYIVFGSFFRFPLSKFLKTQNPELRQILLHFSAYYGKEAEKIVAIFPMLANYGYYYDGGYYPKGGGEALALALCKVIEESGGKILLGNAVTEILEEEGVAKGVRTQKGEEIYAKQLIASANPYHLYRDLLPRWSGRESMLAALAKKELSPSCSVLYLATDVPIATLNPSLKEDYEFTYQGEFSESEFYAHLRNLDHFEDDYQRWPIAFSFHSHIDSKIVPQGGGACFDVIILDNYDRWAKLSERAYREQKEKEVKKLLAVVERFLPKIQEHIVVSELGTPKTMERYTRNEKGAIYGFAQIPSQAMFARMPIQSPIKNLQFVSAWTIPGGGFEGSMRATEWLLNKPSKLGLFLTAILIAAMVFIPILLSS